MQVNSLAFFNYCQIENLTLISSNFWAYDPNFELNYYLVDKNKMFILQTFELFYQFYGVRPKLFSLKKFDKFQNFSLILSIRQRNSYQFFKTLHNIRSSSKTKLVNFSFKENGKLYILLQDFITLFQFQIRFYDFHSWRNEVVIHSHPKHTSHFEFFGIINFFYSFFRRP
jgi:hypothetical protein